MKEKEKKNFDCLILGGGPAGFSAAIYAARGNIKTAIIDINMLGGQPCNYLEIENYPGFSLVGGFELMEKFEEHCDKFGVEKYPMSEIENIDLKSEIKTITTDEFIFEAPAVILATGAKPAKLGITGENEFVGRGVSYCAVCDGAFYKDKTVCIIGGGNAAVEEGAYLTKFAKKVYIIHRRNELRADKIVCERAFKNEKIEFVFDTIPLEICGENCVKSILLQNVNTKETFSIETDGVFPYIGFNPNTDGYKGQLNEDERGFILTDTNMQTSQEGVFAAGDVRNTPLRQVITAASDGAIAACSAVKYLDELKTKTLVKTST